MDQLENLVIKIPVILIALTVHEYSHGYIAWLRGDNTAKNEGRLTFNPIAHLDLIGTIMLFFGPFGWAKPVPVNAQNLDNPKRDIIFVSIAGPVSNMILALIFGYTYRFLNYVQLPAEILPYFREFFTLSILINIGLSFFNLLPVPPLDGSNIVIGLLPHNKIGTYLNSMRYVPMIFFGLIIAENMFHIPIFSFILSPLWEPYLKLWQFLIFGGSGV